MRIDTGSFSYETLCQLGKGNYGSVYLAVVADCFDDHLTHLVEGEYVVIKVQQTDSAESKREIAVMTHLRNHVEETSQFAPVLLDVHQDKEQSIIVMDYIEYSLDVFDVIQQLSKLPRSDATRKIRIEIMWQMLLCVYSLHTEYGVFHRDIKPENFLTGELKHFTDQEMLKGWKQVSPLRQIPDMTGMSNLERYVALRICSTNVDLNEELAFVSHFVSGPLYVKIIDFGLSTMLDPSFPSDGKVTFLGTPSYLCPWYIACNKSLKDSYPATDMEETYRRIDAWSLGMTIFALFHGFLPFTDSTPRDARFALADLDDAGVSSFELAHKMCNWKDTYTLFVGFFTMIGGENALNVPVRAALRVSERHTPSFKSMVGMQQRIEDDMQQGIFDQKLIDKFENDNILWQDAETMQIVSGLLQIYPEDRDVDFYSMAERLQAL